MNGNNGDRRSTKMAALGRRFQLGDLYDYHDDRILTECRWWWESVDVEKATRSDDRLKFKYVCPDSEYTCNKWELMKLDEHMQASIVAGLVGKSRGASNYLSEKPNPMQVTRVLVCRTKSRKEWLDLATVLEHNASRIPQPHEDGSEDVKLPSATHVVIGVTYGAESYCVLVHDLGADAFDQDAREEAEEMLSSLAMKMADALQENQDAAEFKEQFSKDEKRISRLKCRLYSDFQAQAVREFGVFEVYKHCRKFMDLIRKSSGLSGESSNAVSVPISALLCPLQVVMSNIGRYPGKFKFRDIDPDLAIRCCRIWQQLEQAEARAEAIKTSLRSKASREPIRNFVTALNKYRELFRKRLREGIVKARESFDIDDEDVTKTVKIAESHPLFKPSRLDRWLRYKQAESDMVAKMSSVKEAIFLADRKLLQKELDESFDKKYSFVLSVPPLDERTNSILEGMMAYVENYTKLVPVEGAEDDDDTADEEDGHLDDDQVPWHMIQRKRKQVLDKVHQMIEHAGNNDHLEKQVQYIITFAESGKKFACYYSIYEADQLLKDNLNRPPEPPINLCIQRAKNSSSSIRLLWDFEDTGYSPCHFWVEYRLKGVSDSWRRQKTSKIGDTHIIINAGRPDSVVEFRVAADSCIGRGEFSQVMDSESGIDDYDAGTQHGRSMNSFDDSSSVANNSVNNCSFQIEEAECSVSHPAHQQSFRQDNNNDRFNSSSSRQEPERISTQPIRMSSPTVSQQQLQQQAPPIHREETKQATLQAPTGVKEENVTQTSVELTWTMPLRSPGRAPVPYRIRYWPNGRRDAVREVDVDSGDCYYCLEQLEPDTEYCATMLTVSSDGLRVSRTSDIVTFTTLASGRFAESIVKRCQKIGNRNGMDMYAVPLSKSTEWRATAERYVFGRPEGRKGVAGQQSGQRRQHKTILVMGASGSGKTTLINGMINYIFNVEWQDTFRFQLIQEQQVGRSQIESQTSRITAYDIYYKEGFRIPYSLTIVDTPGFGDTKGLDRDKEITEMVRQFFADKAGIQELDVVGFVSQASLPRLTPTQIYIFDSVLSIFGKDVEENINFLLTFADSQTPPVLNAIVEAGLPCSTDGSGNPLHHKFNNSGFFCSSRESGSGANKTVDKFNRFFWRMGMENFQSFFAGLAAMKTKSLSLTKQVLEERKQLEATVDGLQPLIKIGLAKMEEMRKINQMIFNSTVQIDANENVEFNVEVFEPVKIDIPHGQYLTNCNKCYVTCHNPCAIPNDDGKVDCAAMDYKMPREIRSCRVCPEKCIWNMHANQPYRWEYVKKNKATSSEEIKRKYEKELKRKLTAEELLKELQKDLDANDKLMLERITTVARCIQRLDQIALRPNPFSTPQYIDLIIDAEQQEKRPGFKERIESLKKLRNMADICDKIKKGERLINVNRDEDPTAAASASYPAITFVDDDDMSGQ